MKKKGKPVGTRGKQHVPTDETRERVMEAVGLGGTQDFIARMLGIAKGTLEKAYRRELDVGGEVALQRVAKRLYERAMTEKGMPGVTACIYFMKARGKGQWRDDFRTVEHVDADGKPVKPQGNVVIVLPDNGRTPLPALQQRKGMKMIEAQPVERDGAE